MISSTFDPLNFKTVPPTYSWDQGTPGIDYDPLAYITSLSANKTISTENDEGIEYVGYAPFVYISLSSFPGDIRDDHLALERTVDFGDYYNSESNKQTAPGLSSEKFCHIYVMPGLYTITYTRTEHTYYEYIDSVNCLQKYCISWSFESLDALCKANRGNPVTWRSAQTGGVYQKKWEFERCEASEYMTAGLYVQPTDKAVKHPLSWQWFHFLQTPLDRRNDPIVWLSAGFQQDKQFTWNDSNGPCVTLPIEGITWRWDKLVFPPLTATLAEKLLIKGITWDELATTSPQNTTWDFAKNNCSTVGTIVLSANTQTITKKAIVRVKEIPPTAYLTVQQPEDRLSPLTVRLSPKDTICGSFPIEKIVWDLGDGSPLIEQRRWSNTLEKPFAFSGALGNDYEDPRNYDVIHTYVRSADSPSTFYPSMTAYAANTYTSDSASVMVGPLKYKNTDGSNFRLLQSELTDQGKAVIGQIDNTNVSFWKIDTIFKDIITIQQTYYYFGYYSSDRPLINGQSVLYTGIYSNSSKAVSLSGMYALTVDMAENGSAPDKDLWQTDENGVVSWSKYLAHPVSLQTFVDLDIDPALPTSEPYNESYGFFVDTPVLTSGVSVLYDKEGSSAGFVPNEIFDNLDIDDDGKIDTFTTNASGVISWTPKIYGQQFYPGLSGYTRSQTISSGITKLYDSPYSDANIVRLEQGTSRLKQGDNNLYQWSTDGYGVITYNSVIAHPYAVGQPVIGYVDVANLQQNSLILWSGQGTAATPITFSENLTSDIDGDGNIDDWWTDASGRLSWGQKTVHFISLGDSGYYTDSITETILISSGKNILWSGSGSGATKVLNLTGEAYLYDYELVFDSLTLKPSVYRLYRWSTNSNGTLTISAAIFHPYRLNLDPLSSIDGFNEYYSDESTRVSRNPELDIPGSLIWSDYGSEASLVTDLTGIGDVDGDGNYEQWSINNAGRITFSTISAHPYKQFYGYSDHEILSSGISVLWTGQGTSSTIVAVSAGVTDVDKDGSLDSWYVSKTGVIRWTMFDAHPWEQFYGFSDEGQLTNGVSILWDGKGSAATLLSGVSGIFDVDFDGNFDLWKTNENGILSWVTLTAHPFIQSQLGGDYYTDSPILTSGRSILWNDYKSSANFVQNLTGIYDFEGDGDLDSWSTNAVGRLIWRPVIAHPFPKLNYFTDTFILTSGSSKLWSRRGTGAVVMSGIEGDEDVDGDGNEDYWYTLDDGTIKWNTIEYYGNVFLNTQYFTEENFLINGSTIVWDGKYSSATIVKNVTGEAVDLDNDGDNIPDTWIINSDGVLSWTKRVDYPYQFPGLSGFTNTQFITSGVTILRNTKFVDAEPVINDSGFYLNRDNDLSEWQTNSSGVITWTLLSAHPYKQPNNYFTDNPLLTSGSSVLWTKVGTGAVRLTGASGTALLDNDLDLDAWSTDSLGILSWVPLSVYPFKHFFGFSDTLKLVSGVTRLKNKPTSTALGVGISAGIYDVDGDGNLDSWTTNGIGTITYAISVVHPHKLSYGRYYTDTQELIRNETVIWDGPGTGAKILSGITLANQPRGEMIDRDEDGNVDYIITNPNGTYNWQMFIEYPRPVLGGSYFTNELHLRSGYSRVYLDQGSGSLYATNVSNTPTVSTLNDGTVITYNSDIDGDGNLGTWSIDGNGILTFAKVQLYPYETIPGYYTKQPTLTSGVSKIFKNFGTSATIATNLTGANLLDNDSKLDYWTTDSFGVVTWVTLTSHPYSQFGGYSDTPTIERDLTVLYQDKFSDAPIVSQSTGTVDVDKDGNLDLYEITNRGTVLWYTITAHPYLQFPGLLSAADTRVLTTPISVAGNPTIPGTNVTYYSITSYDTLKGADGVIRPAFVRLDGHYPVPERPLDQTYTVLTAADVIPLVINGVTQTAPISVAGNLDIPGTSFTYRMIPRNDGYTDFKIPNTGDVLYESYGTGAKPLTGVQGYSLVGPHSAYWNTNNFGNLTINYVSAHPYFQFYLKTEGDVKEIVASFYTDTVNIISGVSILWSDYRTAAEKVTNLKGIDDIDRDGTEEEWYTDSNGIIHFKLSITIGTYFYSVVSRNWFDIQNWHIYSNRSAGANRLPLSSTNVVILGGGFPAFVDLNDTRWVQPSSIDASAGGIEFYATTPTAVTCPLSGSVGAPVKVTGKATLGTSAGNKIYGRYWSSESDTNWYTLSNWYYDSDKIYQANSLPLSTHHTTIMEGSVRPYVDLDNALWVQPRSISFVGVGIEFFSDNKRYVDCLLIGEPKLFFGNSREGKEPEVGAYWHSETNTDWFALSSWYADEFQKVKADVLPTSATNVTIVSAASLFVQLDENVNILTEEDESFEIEGYIIKPVIPYVNIDRTDWVQPSSIDVRNAGIIFESFNPAGKAVNCPIYGNPTFRGYAEYRDQTS